MRRGLQMLALAALCGCVTARDEARLDESGKGDAPSQDKAGRTCGPDAKGDLVLLDARTGGPVTCMAVTLTTEPMSCAVSADCPSDVLFRGYTNARGQVAVAQPFAGVRLVAVADGYDPSYLPDAKLQKDKLLEVELAPADGFWLKVLDGEGNYLPDVSIAFKQGDATIAQLRSNVLANVFFTQRQPFSGDPVKVEADGFQSMTVAGVQDLGDDGHTLVLRK